MAANTPSLNKLIGLIQLVSQNHLMVKDFRFGPLWNLNALDGLNAPYIWLEEGPSKITMGNGSHKTALYNFNLYCMDRIQKDSTNYNEILSDTKFILDTIITELDQHPLFVSLGISFDINNDVIIEPVLEELDTNSNGHKATITLRFPIRYTPCNVPISTLAGYTYSLNNNVYQYSVTGVPGATGPQGPAGGGPTGSQGVQGTQGPTGPQGTIGIQGVTGPQGFQGTIGIQGLTGPQGFQGSIGFQGFQGSTGPQGLQGVSGPQGTQGPTGPQGLQGFQGIKGNTGSQGPTGPQGFQGTIGIQGVTGPQGLQGNDGMDGLQGATGPQGSIGSLTSPNGTIDIGGSYTIDVDETIDYVWSGEHQFNGDVFVTHIGGTGSTPGITSSTGAGVGATITILGNDARGVITVIPAGAPAAPAVIVTVIFATPYTTAPLAVLITPGSADVSTLATQPYVNQVNITTTQFDIRSNINPLNATRKYVWYYYVMQ